MIVHLKHTELREEYLTRVKVTYSKQIYPKSDHPNRIVVIFVNQIEQEHLGFRITVGNKEFMTSFDSLLKVI